MLALKQIREAFTVLFAVDFTFKVHLSEVLQKLSAFRWLHSLAETWFPVAKVPVHVPMNRKVINTLTEEYSQYLTSAVQASFPINYRKA